MHQPHPTWKSELETTKEDPRLPSAREVTFAVVNLRKMDLSRFERTLARQSRYIGQANFPRLHGLHLDRDLRRGGRAAWTLGNLRLFVEETEEEPDRSSKSGSDCACGKRLFPRERSLW
jgi:hypothetical protein